MQPARGIGDQVGIGFEVEDMQGAPVQTPVVRGDACTGPCAAALGQRGPDHCAAGCDPRQPVGLLYGAAGQHQGCGHHARMRHKGHGCHPIAQRFCRQASLQRAHAQATMGLGNQQAVQADLAQAGPQVSRTRLITVSKGAYPRERGLLAQVHLEGFSQQVLIR